MKLIDNQMITRLTEGAQKSERKRKNLNFHLSDADPIQRMLNAFEPKTYVRPHTHVNPDKREVFLILKGKLLVIFFSDEGVVQKHVVLDRDTGHYGVEILPGEWHTATGLEEGTVAYEIKDGPYIIADDKNFATWAPDENTLESEMLMKKWLKDLGLSCDDEL